MTCFQDDFEACIAHLRMPVKHRKAIRTTPQPNSAQIPRGLLQMLTEGERICKIVGDPDAITVTEVRSRAHDRLAAIWWEW